MNCQYAFYRHTETISSTHIIFFFVLLLYNVRIENRTLKFIYFLRFIRAFTIFHRYKNSL